MKTNPSKKTEQKASFEAGTYQLAVVDAFIDRIESKDYPKNNGNPKITLFWEDLEADEGAGRLRDGFLNLPSGVNFTNEAKYKSKFQKRVEALAGVALSDENEIEIVFEGADYDWDSLLLEIAENDEDKKPMRIGVTDILVSGKGFDAPLSLFNKEATVVVEETTKGDNTYTNVTNVAPIARRTRRSSAPASAPVSPAAAARAVKTAPATEQPIDDDNLPF